MKKTLETASWSGIQRKVARSNRTKNEKKKVFFNRSELLLKPVQARPRADRVPGFHCVSVVFPLCFTQRHVVECFTQNVSRAMLLEIDRCFTDLQPHCFGTFLRDHSHTKYCHIGTGHEPVTPDAGLRQQQQAARWPQPVTIGATA